MLREFKRSTENVRLRIHPGKTKIPSKQSSNIRREIEIDDIKVEILTRIESTKYLGQMITFQQQETTEIRNRIWAAWATFHKYRQELTSRTYRLRHRLRLFDAVVSHTMNYASGTYAKCLASSYKQIEDTKRSRNQKNETKENNDTNDVSSTEDENEDGQSSNTQRSGQRYIFRN